jgi:hypothetical protein
MRLVSKRAGLRAAVYENIGSPKSEHPLLFPRAIAECCHHEKSCASRRLRSPPVPARPGRVMGSSAALAGAASFVRNRRAAQNETMNSHMIDITS